MSTENTDLLTRIQMNRNTMTPSERKACDAIMEDMLLVQHNSLAELSQEIGVTKTSILRFCQKLGYSGYSQFKFELINYVNSRHQKNQGTHNAITAVDQLYINAIGLLDQSLQEKEMQSLAKDILRAKRVVCAGAINSYVSAIQLHYALLMYGVTTTVVGSQEDLRCLDMVLEKNDIIVLYSVSARSPIVQAAFNLREQTNCRIALVTMNRTEGIRADHRMCLPDIGAPEKSLLQNIPLFTIFNEILLNYLSQMPSA